MSNALTLSEEFVHRHRMIAAITFAVATLPGCKGSPHAEKGSLEPSAESTTLTPAGRPLTVAEQGRVLFMDNNCVGCHGGLAGGGMGPSLRDTVWKYGGSDSSIYHSINDGRPMGMPVWGRKLSPIQIKTLVSYIETMRTPNEPKFFWIDTAASRAR